MVAIGDATFGSFTGAGIWKYDGASWTQITPNNPTIMTIRGVHLYASFADQGIWRYASAEWSLITTGTPDKMMGVGGTLYASFPGQGTWRYNGKWVQITNVNPDEIISVRRK
jgi:hypothetical protein